MTKIAIIGLGYVGLPLAKLFLENGNTVYGIDTDTNKINLLINGESYLTDLNNEEIQAMMQSRSFFPSSNFQSIREADAIILCVPTPLKENFTPDVSYIENAINACIPHLQKGQLIILESSTYPGTTEDIIVPLLLERGLIPGENVYLAYSPERIDPGQTKYNLSDIPKIIGGVTPACTEKARNIYSKIFKQLVPVSSVKTAEMSKLVENAQRLINISFMNELAIFCDKLGINIWEVIEACSTKPFGFTPYYPGPGIGGHCIPVDPIFLLWKASEENTELSLINAAHQINNNMSDYVVNKVIKNLKKPLSSSTILIVGITYKKDVNDIRESKAVAIAEKLINLGAAIKYHDPYIPSIKISGKTLINVPLDSNIIRNADCTLVLTDHSQISYKLISEHSNLIIDTRNALKEYPNRKNIIN